MAAQAAGIPVKMMTSWMPISERVSRIRNLPGCAGIGG